MAVRLNTFGRPHLARDDGEEVALQPLQIALLAYLSVGGPRNRDHLAELFWHKSKNSLNSLSTTLHRIRAHIPDRVWIEGNSIVGTDLPSDSDDFRNAIDQGDFELARQLYRAPFLDGLKLRQKSIEFDEWVLEERATLASMVELTLLRRGMDLYEAGDYRAAAVAAEEAWKIAIRDGFPSPDYFATYHRILISAAKPTASAVRSMAKEFGIPLSPAEPIAFESNATSNPLDPPPSVIRESKAAAASPLFGHEHELQTIASSAGSPGLTTIVGLGGSGKTRLAAEFFDSSDAQRDFSQRHWVHLSDVADQDLVAAAIATATGQRFESVSALADQLGKDEPVESLVQLSGLDASEGEGDSPAEQLFLSAARRAGVSEDRVRDVDRSAIRQICRQVGGNPLALQIAGGWALLLSPPQILEALSSDNELLGASMVGEVRPMDTVLEQSWSTLAETEQNTLMLLAIFPAGCLTSEALKLQGLSIRSIGQLVQHSLVRLHVEGRITLHPLVANHALTELEQRPELQREFQHVLSEWCQSFSTAVQARSTTDYSNEYAAEIPNFARAWSSAAQHSRWALHRQTLAPLRTFFGESGRISEGKAIFATAATALRTSQNRPDDLLAAVLEALGWFDFLSGDLSNAQTRLDEAFSIYPDDHRRGRAQVLRSLGVLKLMRGEVDGAAANFRTGLTLLDDEPGSLTASLQYDLAQAHHYQGQREQAKSAARLALQAGRSSNNWTVLTTSYLLLADIEVESDPRRAIVLLNEGWAIAQQASLDSLAIYFPHILGLAHVKLDEADFAEQYFTEGLKAASDLGQLPTVCANYIGRAEAHLLNSDVASAIDDLRSGIRLALATETGRYLMWAAVVSCRAAATIQKPGGEIRDLLLLVLGHPAADQDAQDMARASLDDFFGDETATTDLRLDDDMPALDEVAERSLQLFVLES